MNRAENRVTMVISRMTMVTSRISLVMGRIAMVLGRVTMGISMAPMIIRIELHLGYLQLAQDLQAAEGRVQCSPQPGGLEP